MCSQHFSPSTYIVGYQGWNSEYQTENPRSDCFFRSSLIWVCTVCQGLFGRQLVFKILEHLPYVTLYLFQLPHRPYITHYSMATGLVTHFWQATQEVSLSIVARISQLYPVCSLMSLYKPLNIKVQLNTALECLLIFYSKINNSILTLENF